MELTPCGRAFNSGLLTKFSGDGRHHGVLSDLRDRLEIDLSGKSHGCAGEKETDVIRRRRYTVLANMRVKMQRDF